MKAITEPQARPRYEMLPELAEKRWFFHRELEETFNCTVNAIRGQDGDTYLAAVEWTASPGRLPSKKDIQNLASSHGLSIEEWEVEATSNNLRERTGFLKVTRQPD